MSIVDSQRGATWVVELTPPGRAAISVVLVAGLKAHRAVEKFFHPVGRRSLDQVPMGRIVLGRWGGPAGEELIAYRRSAESIEIHCHGGVAAVNAVIDRLVELGCQRTSWQKWLHQSSRDPIRAAAQIALAEAPTLRTAAILLDQYDGALTSAVQQVAVCVAAGDWTQATATIDALLTYRDVGLHLTTPWRVVLTGRTNVGKSSLINALAGFERAIVSQQPGTTRDVVTTLTAIDSWPVELADTAGARETDDELESAGIALASAKIAAADLIIAVHDATEQIAWRSDSGNSIETLELRLPINARVLQVVSKIDLIPAYIRKDAPGSASAFVEAGNIPLPKQTAPILTSAVTGEGIADLLAHIGRVLVPQAPPVGAPVPFSQSHVEALEAARMAAERRNAPAAVAALQALLAS